VALRYLLDENLRGPLWTALARTNARRAQPLEIACVGEETELPLGTGDPELLLWAEQHGFVMISNDARTMPGHFAAHIDAGHHSPGVFLIALPGSIPEILDALFYYADASDDDLWRDQILFVPCMSLARTPAFVLTSSGGT
jgi:hypothetical protein